MRSGLLVAVDDRDAEGWEFRFGGVLGVGLRGLARVVVAPEPGQLFGELCATVGGAPLEIVKQYVESQKNV